MFLLTMLPGFVFPLLITLGTILFLASLFLTQFPFISQYGIPLKFVAVLILTFGVFFEGAKLNQVEWELKVAEAEKQVLESNAKAEEATRKLAEELAKKDKEILVNKSYYKKKLKDLAGQLDKQCKIDQPVIDILNNAAANAKEPK